MKPISHPDRIFSKSIYWPLLLAMVVIIGSLALACMMPFSAVAVLLALALPWQRAALAMTGIWFANQLIGYTLLDYPVNASSFGWGGALILAAFAGIFAVNKLISTRSQLSLATLIMAFAASFIAYETCLFLFGLAIGDISAFTPSIIVTILINDSLWFAGLMLLRPIGRQIQPGWFAGEMHIEAR